MTQSTPSKRARFNKSTVPLQTPILSKTSIQNELFLLEDLLEHFFLSPPISESRLDILFLPLSNWISHLQPPPL